MSQNRTVHPRAVTPAVNFFATKHEETQQMNDGKDPGALKPEKDFG